jgi:hypothetical protein
LLANGFIVCGFDDPMGWSVNRSTLVVARKVIKDAVEKWADQAWSFQKDVKADTIQTLAISGTGEKVPRDLSKVWISFVDGRRSGDFWKTIRRQQSKSEKVQMLTTVTLTIDVTTESHSTSGQSQSWSEKHGIWKANWDVTDHIRQIFFFSKSVNIHLNLPSLNYRAEFWVVPHFSSEGLLIWWRNHLNWDFDRILWSLPHTTTGRDRWSTSPFMTSFLVFFCDHESSQRFNQFHFQCGFDCSPSLITNCKLKGAMRIFKHSDLRSSESQVGLVTRVERK